MIKNTIIILSIIFIGFLLFTFSRTASYEAPNDSVSAVETPYPTFIPCENDGCKG